LSPWYVQVVVPRLDGHCKRATGGADFERDGGQRFCSTGCRQIT
jgi:hypothetical protein